MNKLLNMHAKKPVRCWDDEEWEIKDNNTPFIVGKILQFIEGIERVHQ